MKYFIFLLFFFQAKTKDIIVRFNAGYGSLIDSIDIGNKTYYAASLIKVPENQTSDVRIYVTCDNNGNKDTYIQLIFKNGIVSDKIKFRKQPRKEGARPTVGTFRSVSIANLEKIELTEQ